MASKQAKVKKTTAAVKDALSVTSRQRVSAIAALAAEVGKVAESKRAEIMALTLKEFPTVKDVKDYNGKWRPFAGALRKATDNGWGYQVFLACIKETYKGLPNKQGKIQTPSVIKAAKKSKRGWTAGRFLNAWLTKLGACATYVENLPEDLIEPEMLATITSFVELLNEHKTAVEEYKENEAAAAEADKKQA